MVSFLSHEPKM